MSYRIIEKFVSIDGEGPLAGELAVFIRFEGCNLRCSWCDTKYSWDSSVVAEKLTAQAIYDYIKETGINHVTLTGGEPLIQPQIKALLDLLVADKTLLVHVETNGAVAIRPFIKAYPVEHLRYIVDYKLGTSGMMGTMLTDNLEAVRTIDVYKFVVGSEEDLVKAYEIIKTHQLHHKVKVYLSPVLGQIEPSLIVDWMKAHPLEGIRLQLQLHKFIWDKEERGV